MSESIKSYSVNYLLSVSRLPDHFYSLVENLKGRDELYKNPGISLRSFIIAHCIRQEIVQISGEILEVVKLCEEFSCSTRVLSHIVNQLQEMSDNLCELISKLPDEVRSNFTMHTLPIRELSRVVKLSFDSFIMNQDPTSDRVDLMSVHGINLKSLMFDLYKLITDISSQLPSSPNLKA